MELETSMEDALMQQANATSFEDPQVREEKNFKTYPVRFYILVVQCFTIMFASTIRYSFSSIDDEAQAYWGVSSSAIDWLISGSCLLYPVGSAVGEVLQARQGFVTMVRSAQALTTVGCALRLLACLWGTPGGYALLLVGQMMGAVGAPPLFNSAGVVGTAWFPMAERDNMLACAVAAELAGLSLGYFLSALLVNEASDGSVTGMALYLGLELAANAAGLAWLWAAVGAAPPSPPSRAAARLRALEAAAEADAAARTLGGALRAKTGALRALLRDRQAALLVGGFSLIATGYQSFFGLVEEYTGVAGFSDAQAAAMAIAYFIAGLVSVLLLNVLIRGRIQMFPVLQSIITGGVVLVGGGLVAAVCPGDFSTALVLAAAQGIFVCALPPIVMALVVEAIFPMEASLGIGVAKGSTYLFTFVGMQVLNYLIEWQPTYVGIISGANCFFMVCYLGGAALLWSYKPQLRRYEAELQREFGRSSLGVEEAAQVR